MPSVYDTLYRWARRTTSSFAELRFVPSEPHPIGNEGDGLIYRLKHWPELPGRARTASLLRVLSVMSHQFVNRQWILAHSRLGAQDVDRLLARLIQQDAVEVIDGSRYPAPGQHGG